MYARSMIASLASISQAFPVVLLTGPRQVGKTTLLEMCAQQGRAYVSLDDLDIRNLARQDPGLFIQTYRPPIIIDEVQYAPELFSYIKLVVDKEKQNGLYWLTGSQKFHLMQGISESLAGRVAVLDLLGLSRAELGDKGALSLPFLPDATWLAHAREHLQQPCTPEQIYQQIWQGAFPRVQQDAHAHRDIFYRSYVQTYIQRDVRDMLRITDELAFHRFLTVAAARTGQLLNYADMARDVGVDNKTIKAWLALLETSGLVYLLPPYYNNISKRLVKTPKLYFLDTGLCAYLTKWTDAATLQAGAMSGAILESYLFAELLKSYWHNAQAAHFYYYRDTDQKEVDLLIEAGDTLYPVEFKKTATPSRTAPKQFDVLHKLGKTIGPGGVLCFVEKEVPLSREVMAIPIAYV